MAHLFPDCLGEVDVVANAENIKCLLKLPYASNCSISMMVHRIGNTLLIDDFDVHRFLLQQEDCNWQWLKSFICEHILTRLNDTERNFLNNQPTTSRSDAAVQQRSLLSKFLYHSLSTSTVSKTELNDALDIKLANQSAKHLQYGPLLPDPNIEENVPDPKHTKHTYNRNVIWTFEDIRMLIGTDMAIFGGASRPCISLRLRDMRQPINVLTGIDYWLDNLMCNVPEVVMCYHLDGLVQKYEIIKTEDLPFIENSKFQPNVIRNVAQNILSFLKQNATKSGHTYWLFKGRKDDVVKLYDLTSLMNSATNEFGGHAKPPSNDCNVDDGANQENMTKTDDKNPFTVPVAMLLYKVARNMKNSKEHIKAKQAGSIKALLDNCIKLLPKEQYPQIVASSYYLLSDLHIPSKTDPMSPKFDNEPSKSKDCHDEDDDENNSSDDSASTSGVEEQQQQQKHQCTTKKVSNENSNSLPPPLSGTVDERCSSALQYIADGLNCLQYFSMNEAKLAKEREEIEKQTEKMRIIQEEQNPNMAKPYQAIPLPYEKIRQNLESEATDQNETSGATGGSTTNKSIQQKSTKDDQLFVRKPPPPVVQSWNVHLKLLFFEKSCLIYAILTEQAYQRKEYGNALKYISIAMKYYDIVSMHQFYCMSVGSNYRTNLLARAGDCYFKCAQDFQNINTHLNAYNMRRDIDAKIEKELEKDEKELTKDDGKCGAEIRLVKPIDNLEQLILISISYYETALKYTDGRESRDEILGRIGSVLNELGIKYMNWSQEQYQKVNNDAVPDLTFSTEQPTDDDAKKPEPEDIYLSLAIKSYECLIRGVAIFEEINDNANLAILLCNFGRFMRFRAHLQRDRDFGYKKTCYENAFTSYQRALTILESKKQNLYLWDLVTWELSTGKFTLAKYMQHMQQGREVSQKRYYHINRWKIDRFDYFQFAE